VRAQPASPVLLDLLDLPGLLDRLAQRRQPPI
jgi:hypothetical protein